MKNPIVVSAIGFANLLVVSLVAGAVFGIWLGYNPASLSFGADVEHQQNAIRALNVSMPVLGAIGILLTLISATLARTERRTLVLLVEAALFLVAAGLVTRLGNQPINAVVMNWRAASPPADCVQLRAEWWTWHTVQPNNGVHRVRYQRQDSKRCCSLC